MIELEDQEIKTNVLVVDQEQSIVNLIVEYLSSKNYNVLSASDGEEALSLINVLPVDIVLTDTHTQKSDGVELLQIIKKEYRELRVIMMSTSFTDAILYYKNGAINLLNKPFDLDDLTGVIQKTSSNRRSTYRFTSKDLLVSKLAAGEYCTELESVVENISLDGALFETHETYQQHDDVEIELLYASDYSFFKILKAKVIRVISNDSTSLNQVAVYFHPSRPLDFLFQLNLQN